jgi:hypothetical protein
LLKNDYDEAEYVKVCDNELLFGVNLLLDDNSLLKRLIFGTFSIILLEYNYKILIYNFKF